MFHVKQKLEIPGQAGNDIELSYRTNIAQQSLLNQFLEEQGVQLSSEVLGKLYDYADKYTNTEYKETGHIQTLEENKTVMGYIDNFAEKGEIPKAKVTPTNPSEEPEI